MRCTTEDGQMLEALIRAAHEEFGYLVQPPDGKLWAWAVRMRKLKKQLPETRKLRVIIRSDGQIEIRSSGAGASASASSSSSASSAE